MKKETQLDRDIKFLRECGITREWERPLRVMTFFSILAYKPNEKEKQNVSS
jgi:hypothetical protein